jgi:hypothetical protein
MSETQKEEEYSFQYRIQLNNTLQFCNDEDKIWF